MKIKNNNKAIYSKYLWALFCCTWLASASMADETIVLKGANTRIAVSEGIKKISIGNPAIIDAKPTDDARFVLITGLTEGSSELRIERLQGADLVTKVVVGTDLELMLSQIKELLSDLEGLEMKPVGQKIVIKGKIVSKTDYDQLNKVVDAYAGVILNMTKFDSGVGNQYMEKAILKDIGFDLITAQVKDDTVTLQGVVYSETEKERASVMAKRWIPNVLNLLSVQEVMIETDVEFVQLNTGEGSDFGNNILKNTAGAGTFSGGSTGKPQLGYGVASSVKINASVMKSSGNVMNRMHVSSKSGVEASSMVGGQLLIPVTGNVGGSLEKISYGVIIKVKPTLQGRDTIDSLVTVEVSMPIAGGLDKAETTTTVRCKVGETVVLSGLSQVLGNRSNEKAPGLGDVPLLKLFFSEKTSNKSAKEGVILLTPRVTTASVAAGNAFSEEQKKDLNAKASGK